MLKTVSVPKLRSDYNNKTLDIVNTDFSVKINGQVVDCFQSRCSKIPFNRIYEGEQRNLNQTEILGFISFESDSPVEIEVTNKKPFENAVVRPLSKKISTEKSGDTVKFILSEYGQYNLELDDEHNSLSIFFNEIREFKSKEFYTYYFGAGAHFVGMLNLKSGDKVYIDKDAIVYGGIYAKDSSDILIEGYGVIDGKCLNRLARGFFNRGNVYMENCKNVKIDGIIMQDSAFWVSAFFNCDGVYINNVKLTGQWRYNTDGVDFVNCKNASLTNSFLHCFDDALVIKAMSHCQDVTIDVVENIRVDNCVFWCNWGRTIEFGIETVAKEYKNISVTNCDLIHNSASAIDIQNGNCALIHDILIENVNVEFHKSTMPEVYQERLDQEYNGYGKIGMPYLIWIDNHKYTLGGGLSEYDKMVKEYEGAGEFGMVKDLSINNVRVFAEEGLPKLKMKILSLDEKKPFENISITGLTVNGQKATADMFELVVDERIENLKIF